ncbi:hypothetical protein EKK58_11885 [Candidatus Dependentiae bacterium]|nr:MAG: hypothetical protein EKK58_11885 [Candidatus Dependentiae bacterium]
MQISNKTYDIGKYLVTIVLPAIATLYIGLGNLWNLPKTTEIVGSITLVNAFLGSLLMVSSKTYQEKQSL